MNTEPIARFLKHEFEVKDRSNPGYDAMVAHLFIRASVEFPAAELGEVEKIIRGIIRKGWKLAELD